LTPAEIRAIQFEDMSQLLADTQTMRPLPYNTEVCGREFMVLRHVFSPLYYSETEFFARRLPSQRGKRFLEIGSGTGAISVLAALQGASRVVAVDENPEAVVNTRLNVDRHGVAGIVDVRLGDVFGPILPQERFDTIFWALPVGNIDRSRSRLNLLERAIFDPGLELCHRFMAQSRSYLSPGGRILFGASPTLGDSSGIRRIAADNGVQLRLLEEIATLDEDRPVRARWPIVWQLIESRY